MKAQHSLLSISAAMIAAMLGACAGRAGGQRNVLASGAGRRNIRFSKIQLLGELMLYDKQLSVKHDEACAFCHIPEAGFSWHIADLSSKARDLAPAEAAEFALGRQDCSRARHQNSRAYRRGRPQEPQ